MQRVERIPVAAAEVAVDHQQHQIGPHGHPGGQSSTAIGVDFVDAGGVDQLNPVQMPEGQPPVDGGLPAGAAVGHIGVQHPLADQGIDQAGFADAHPAENGDAQPALLQALQLLVQQVQLPPQQPLFAGAQPQVVAPSRQQQSAALAGAGAPGHGAGLRHQPASTASTASAPTTPTNPPNSSTTTRTPRLSRRKLVSRRSARIISGT